MQAVWAYARFAFINVFQLVFIATMLMGGVWMWAGLVLAATFVVLDEFFEDTLERRYTKPWILNVLLYLNLPSLLAIGAVYAFFLGDIDPLGLAVLAGAAFDIDLIANRANTSAIELFASGLIVALFFGAAGINAAHELAHRTQSLFDQTIGRWMLAFTCDTTFPIEHVDGHHKHVGMADDPATARRGEYVLTFIVRSTVGCFVNAFKAEGRRLGAQGRPQWSLRNRALRGQLMSLTYCLGFYWLAGWTGALAFLVLAANGKIYLEAVNYIEHYGLVRAKGTPIRPHHSWDCYQAISTTFLYNLTRHADHHVHSHKAYWSSTVADGALRMPHGYMTMILASFVPSLWRRITAPGLAFWDAQVASDEERALVCVPTYTKGTDY